MIEAFNLNNGTKIRMMFGDNIHLMSSIPDNFYSLANVDPEYGLGDNIWNRDRFGTRHIKQKNGKILSRSFEPYTRKSWNDQPPPKEYFDELFRISKHQIIWGVNYYTSYYNFGPGRIVWDKVNYASNFSDCEIAYCSLHDSVRYVKYMWNGMMQGKSLKEGHIQQGNKSLNEKRIHPCQKPVLLYRWCLQQYAEQGWNIIDTHGGSASQVIACDLDGFSIDYMENDREHYDDGVDRVKSHLNQKRLAL